MKSHLVNAKTLFENLTMKGKCMNILLRSQVLDLINKHAGQIFSCEFIKKDGTLRKMVCRTGVKKYLQGGSLAYDPIERGLVPVYEVSPKDSSIPKDDLYRMISLNTMQKLSINGREYQIQDQPVEKVEILEIKVSQPLTKTGKKKAA